jgi:uncharacterized membrane protein YhaH (DUF805 family)
VAATVEISGSSGSTDLLASLSRLLRRRYEYARQFRLVWFYPLVLLIVAYGVAVLSLAPVIERLRDRGTEWHPWVLQAASWLSSHAGLGIAAITIVSGLFAVLFARGGRMSRSERLSLFFESLADQFAHGVAEGDAIHAAATVADEPSLMAIQSPSLASPEVARLLGEAGPFADDTEPAAGIARLRYLGTLQAQRARRRQFIASRLLPRVTMIVVGGGIVLGYVCLVIAPLYRQVAQW